jgi:hypothetical protein
MRFSGLRTPNFSLFLCRKHIILLMGLLGLLVFEGSAKAAELNALSPSILLDPTVFDLGNVVPPIPVIETISVTNLGKSILYISKIKYT